jgi:pimeloyl-ACP methyl ester carboxylesterase
MFDRDADGAKGRAIRERDISVDGVRFEVIESSGTGLPLFAFHGNSSAADSFCALIDSDMGQRHKIIAISLPGHGGSEALSEADASDGYAIENLGRLLARAVASYDYPSYVLLGHSLGGHALLEGLDFFGGAVGLMLVSAPPITVDVLQAAFRPDPSDGLLFRDVLSPDEARSLAACFTASTDPALLNALVRRIQQTDPRFRSSLGASLAAGRLRDELAMLAVAPFPIAHLAGRADRFLRSDYINNMPGERLWCGRTMWFEGCGHALHLEAPQHFEKVLAEFIADIVRPAHEREPLARFPSRVI